MNAGPIDYKVILSPVQKSNRSGFWVTSSKSGDTPAKFFSASDMAEARAIVDAHAAEYGKPCHAVVYPLYMLEDEDAPLPEGFRETFTFKSLYYNLPE
jgi:hypothetical protein